MGRSRIAIVIAGVAMFGVSPGCSQATPIGSSAPGAALRDTLLTLFDSVMAIHQAVPDIALLRRMHPAADTLMFVEGPVAHRFTGDSLARRVITAHHSVTAMAPRIDQRQLQIVDANTAMMTGLERVRWSDQSGAHEWEGLLTLVVARRGNRWVIRGYRD